MTFTEMASMLGRFLLPTAVRRIIGILEDPDEGWRFRAQQDLVEFLQKEIERERGTVAVSLCKISEKAECQVCKSPVIVAEATRCAKCGIPYHVDCFDLMRSCSIFGCGGGK